jgi:hypothetical protein
VKLTVDKVTISSKFGDDLTVEEYEEAERGDLLGQEIKQLYPRISGEFARTLMRGYKAKWQDPITKAVSGRYYSSEEIRKENEEMAKQTQAIKRTILLNMMEHAGQWVTPKQLSKSTGLDLSTTSQRGSLSSAISTLYPFLEKCGVAQRRADPNSKGYVYCYDPEAASNPTEIIDKVFTDFQQYERQRMAEKRAAARGESAPDKKEPKTRTAPQTEGEKALHDQILEKVMNAPALNGSNLNVKVDINIRFGLLKE